MYYAFLWGDHADTPKLVLVSNDLDELKNKLALDAKCETFDDMIDYDEMQDFMDGFNNYVNENCEHGYKDEQSIEKFIGPASDYNDDGCDYILSNNANFNGYYTHHNIYPPEKLSIFALERINVNFDEILRCLRDHNI